MLHNFKVTLAEVGWFIAERFFIALVATLGVFGEAVWTLTILLEIVSLEGLLLSTFIAWLFCVANGAVAFLHARILVVELSISFVSSKVVVIDVSSVIFRFLFTEAVTFPIATFSALIFVFHSLLKEVLI